ncbi:hypothetical protein [Moorena sp. SIO3B2]|uniref:hypothetical protein n=1 Tax=Moorena sp. SIO3B2 TaxID=2607827 RepID=UPI0013C7F4BB|nr:hypothetical protein [Moorena sp. SIO3B2]NEP33237.1 hypothetical protein [Moorena sp. SIO3B2]
MHSTRVPHWPKSIVDHVRIITLNQNLPHLTIWPSIVFMMGIQPDLSLPLNVSIQLSAISYQLSAFSFQLSGISYQLMGPMGRSLCQATDGAFE